MSCHALLQGAFPTQGLNLCFLHWQEGSFPLSHLGSPKSSVDQCQVREKEITLRIKEKGRGRRRGFNSWVRKIPWRRAWPPTPVFLAGEPRGQRSLAGCSRTWLKRLSTHTTLKRTKTEQDTGLTDNYTLCKLSPCLLSPKPHSLRLRALALEPPGPPLPSDLSPEDTTHRPHFLTPPPACPPHTCVLDPAAFVEQLFTLCQKQSVLPSWGRDKIKLLVTFSVFNREKSIQVDWFKSKSYLKEWLDLLHLHCLITSQFMANKKKH